MIARQFIDNGYPVSKVLGLLELPRSSYYYKPRGTTGRGRKCSTHTMTGNGSYLCNQAVVERIQQILSGEFVDYGYEKVTHALLQRYVYQMNKKKVYRLMNQADLLYKRSSSPTANCLL